MIVRCNPFFEIHIRAIRVDPEYLGLRIRHAQDFGELPFPHAHFHPAQKAQFPE